jgi:hypothetical protein
MLMRILGLFLCLLANQLSGKRHGRAASYNIFFEQRNTVRDTYGRGERKKK